MTIGCNGRSASVRAWAKEFATTLTIYVAGMDASTHSSVAGPARAMASARSRSRMSVPLGARSLTNSMSRGAPDTVNRSGDRAGEEAVRVGQIQRRDDLAHTEQHIVPGHRSASSRGEPRR